MSYSNSPRTPALGLLVLTALAICVHGYHLGTDDAAIYVPAIKQAADPGLYPFGAEFFQSHAHLTLFPNLVAGSARLTQLPVDWAILAWHFAGIFLLLLAAWRLLCACFVTDTARWAGVSLLAAALAIPVAGTALVIVDPYVTSRTLSTPATIFSIACYISGRRKQALLWWIFTALIHPQMSVYAVMFLGSLSLGDRLARVRRVPAPGFACLAALPFIFEFHPAQGAAREALFSRTYFFVSQWAWYEWAGVVAPLAILTWFAIAPLRGTHPPFRELARSLVPFGMLFTLAAIVLSADPRLENYTRLQPMRSLHLLYVILFLLLGGLAGEYLLKQTAWRWLALFIPLGLSMFLLGRSTYSSSAHVEWPGAVTANQWTTAFLWIRHNTPQEAVFALDPYYLSRRGEDMHGFRAVAERSMLADAEKDSGAVSLFPALAGEWKAQVESTQGWEHFRLADFKKLADRYPVTWFVTNLPAPQGLLCPYQNQTVAVCRLLR